MKSRIPSVMVTIAVALFGASAGEAQTGKISEEDQACIDCHKELSPSLDLQHAWFRSKHSGGGLR